MKAPLKLISVCSVLAIKSSVHAFVHYVGQTTPSTHMSLRMSSESHDAENQYSNGISRRQFNLVSVAGLAALTTFSGKANAAVFFDTDRYGDKELKIATINKIKQQIRTSILKDLSLGPSYIKLAMQDALNYDASTDAGGPDGSVQFELTKECDKSLAKAMAALTGIKKNVQRTNEVTFADLVAFAGAEALETAGGPRVTVQIGRIDAKAATPKLTFPDGYDWSSPTSEGFTQLFTRAGLGTREIVLLLGAIGEVQVAVTSEEKKKKAAAPVEEEDDEEEEDELSVVPNTFGGQKDIYGGRIGGQGGKGLFGNAYLNRLSQVPASEYKKQPPLEQMMLTDPVLNKWVGKYGANANSFAKDVQEAYQKMTQLGESYTTRNS